MVDQRALLVLVGWEQEVEVLGAAGLVVLAVVLCIDCQARVECLLVVEVIRIVDTMVYQLHLGTRISTTLLLGLHLCLGFRPCIPTCPLTTEEVILDVLVIDNFL